VRPLVLKYGTSELLILYIVIALTFSSVLCAL
jgi:hypothetical protein